MDQRTRYGGHLRVPSEIRRGIGRPPAEVPRPRPPVELATRLQRWVARTLDCLLFVFVQTMLLVLAPKMIGSQTQRTSHAIWLGSVMTHPAILASTLGAALFVGYDAMTQYRSGRTLGKMAMRIRLVRAEWQPLTPTTTFRRALACPGLIALPVVVWGLGLVTATSAAIVVIVACSVDGVVLVSDQNRQSLHDRFAGTIVVRDPSLE